jgi:hypothetical protein
VIYLSIVKRNTPEKLLFSKEDPICKLRELNIAFWGTSFNSLQ